MVVFIANEENNSVPDIGVDGLMKAGALEQIKNGPLFWVSIYTHTHTHTYIHAFLWCVCVCVCVSIGGGWPDEGRSPGADQERAAVLGEYVCVCVCVCLSIYPILHIPSISPPIVNYSNIYIHTHTHTHRWTARTLSLAWVPVG